MKSRKLQKGSTVHIVIIIVLVVAVLGVLGFVFWQNVVNKPTDSQTSTQKTSSEDSNTNSAEVQGLTISEWGVKGDLGEKLAVNYVIEGTDELRLTTDEVDCGSGNGAGSIVRLSGSDKGPGAFNDMSAAETYSATSETNKHIGDYYYFFVSANGVCEVNGIDYTDTVAESLNDATLSLIKTLN